MVAVSVCKVDPQPPDLGQVTIQPTRLTFLFIFIRGGGRIMEVVIPTCHLVWYVYRRKRVWYGYRDRRKSQRQFLSADQRDLVTNYRRLHFRDR